MKKSSPSSKLPKTAAAPEQPTITLLNNIAELVTLQGAAAKEGRRITEADLGIVKKQAVLCFDGKIQWIGPANQVPKDLARKKIQEHELRDQTVLPGFVECHTHTVFAGSRAHEFEMRNNGISYQEIAAKGGGILSTMKQTRDARPAELLRLAQKRVDHFIKQGVTTLEVKSGYALNLSGEIKILETIQKLQRVRTVATFLGAHDLPLEFKTHAEYLEFLVEKVLPEVKRKKLASRVDIFIEKGFFDKSDGQRYLEKAKALGFEVLVHADQLTLSGGSDVALKVGALSSDHLLQITHAEIKRLAASEVTCVLLPASDLYMKKKYPPARKLIDAGARVALATDFNPGSSPTQDLALTGLLARLEMKMTLPEVIAAYTVGAAYALKLQGEIGSIEVGKSADLISTSKTWRELFYSVGDMGIERVWGQNSLLHH